MRKKHTECKPKSDENLNPDQQSTLRTAHMRLCITVHNCRTHHSTEQF